MKSRFTKAVEVIRSVDFQLGASPGKDHHQDAYMILKNKRSTALKTLNRIVAQNPLKLLLKLEGLQHEQKRLEASAGNGTVSWLDYDPSHFLSE